MAKVIMTESFNDGLLLADGRGLVVTPSPAGPKLEFNDFSNFNVVFLDREEIPETFLYKEVTLIKLTTTDTSADLQTQINNSIQTGVNYSDHYSEFNVCDHISQVETKNLNKTISSYDVFTKFNYLSSEYDEFTDALDETNITSVYSSSPVDVSSFINSSDFTAGNSSPNTTTTDTTNILVPSRKVKGDKLNKFPYYNQIKMTNKTKSAFSDLLTRLEISQLFLASYVESPKTPVQFNIQNEGTLYQDQNVEVFDVGEMARVAQITSFLSPDLNKFFITSELEDFSHGKSEIIKNYRINLFLGAIKAYGTNSRTFEEIYEKQSCYFEDYAYSIEKFNNSNAAGAVKQTFYVPSTADGTTVVNDTQVKYGKTYSYKCKTHYIIVGNQYSYRNIRIVRESSTDREHAILEVVNRPQIIIVPIHTFTEAIVTIQPPPIYPQVNFITQNNSSNTIEMYLSPTKGHLFADFQPIMPGDSGQLQLMNLNRRAGQSLYRFDTMRESGLFEIFKMSTPPLAITDFANFRLNDIRMSWIDPGAIFKDKVRPNTKYYYMFRKVNSKGLVSNPTSIYEVELLIDADDSKVVVEEYKIPELPKSKPTHKFQSLFQVAPAMQQVYFDGMQEALYNRTSLKDTLGELTLGVAAKAIWGKKFKFRIKSTTSGKIIDYNVTFTLTKDKSEEDF